MTTKKMSHLEMEYESCRSAKNDVSNWLKKIKLCCETDVLTRDLLVSLIDHIDVSEAYEENGENPSTYLLPILLASKIQRKNLMRLWHKKRQTGNSPPKSNSQSVFPAHKHQKGYL